MTPAEPDVFAPLRAFLLAYVVPSSGVEVVRGLDNRVPPPAGPYVLMTSITQTRLATNSHAYDDSGLPADSAQTITTPLQLDVQLDFYGSLAGSWAAAAVQLFRDALGCDAMAPLFSVLYADDAMQAALVTGEEQYLRRWIVLVSFAYIGATTVPQQFADTLAVELVEVDVRYPPGA